MSARRPRPVDVAPSVPVLDLGPGVLMDSVRLPLVDEVLPVDPWAGDPLGTFARPLPTVVSGWSSVRGTSTATDGTPTRHRRLGTVVST